MATFSLELSLVNRRFRKELSVRWTFLTKQFYSILAHLDDKFPLNKFGTH